MQEFDADAFDAEAHVRHMAAANMAATARAAELVLSMALDEHVEPAPVFEP
ncbi:MAG: DUF4089 domain-containing protein [Rhizobiales bacterium]|nr:DUF4089 domain-containing protein [Hyphomicrobiales bacterium]